MGVGKLSLSIFFPKKHSVQKSLTLTDAGTKENTLLVYIAKHCSISLTKLCIIIMAIHTFSTHIFIFCRLQKVQPLINILQPKVLLVSELHHHLYFPVVL